LYIATEAAKKNQASGTSDNSPGTNSQVQTIDVTASQLESEYRANEVRADQQFRGWLLRVTGVVDRITNIGAHPRVMLRSDDILGGVTCSLDDRPQEAAELERGEHIVVVGIGDGSLIGSPMLRECRVDEVTGPACSVPNADNKGVTIVGECLPMTKCGGGGYYKGVCPGPEAIVCCVK
jgi:tRNA_anti-like